MTRKRKKHVKISNDSANGPDLITIAEKAAADACSNRDLLRRGEQFTVKLFFGVRPSSAFLVDSLGERHPLIGETTHRGYEELLGNYAGEILRFGQVAVLYFPADPSFLASLPPVEGRDGALWRWQLKEPQIVTAEHVWIARGHVELDAEPAAISPTPAKSRSGTKSEAALAFDAAVMRLMDRFWEDRLPNTTPSKNTLEQQVHNELKKPGSIRSARGLLTQPLVNKAAKPWRMPEPDAVASKLKRKND
jgi:hypothetical protein